MLLFRLLNAKLPTSFSIFTLLASPLFTILANAQSSGDLSWVPFNQTQFSGNATLDTKGDVQLFFNIGDEYSTFGIASKSSGYLALGFSETGAMTGGDIAVGYMDGSDFKFENRFASGFVSPELSKDQENNMRFKEGSQKDGVTAFIFEKKNTADCLEEQVNINKDSWQWFIYAFSDENTFSQHKEGNNGKQYVKLGSGKTISINEIRPIDNTKNFTVLQSEVSIPTDETTYCYSLHKVPTGNNNYLLGEVPTRSSDLLHHLVLYACYEDLTDEYKNMIGKEADCNWQNFSNPCNGFVTEWAPGMTGRTFENGYGKPFGGDNYEYIMLETHYNNPNGLKGEKDAATYTLIYSDDPVETEIGTLTLGDMQVEGWFLEPGKDIVKHSTVCTPECTDKWPKEGITAFSVFHHMHYRGRNAEVQIIRDGKEIAPLSTLRHFEYGYQFSKALNEIKLQPGDKLITTCEFDTSKDKNPVPGGLSSQEEMCFAWVDYYPANTIFACTQIVNQQNATVGMCVDSSKSDSDLYNSTFLTSSFVALPESGNQCDASNSTGGGSNNTSGDSADSAASYTLFSSTFLFTVLSIGGLVLAFDLH